VTAIYSTAMGAGLDYF